MVQSECNDLAAVPKHNGGVYSATEHLALSIAGRHLSNVWMVLVKGLTGYFDVSGDPKEEARAYVCAGFGAPVEKWINGFEPVWRRVLAKVGIPELHMTDVVARKKKGFRHLTDESYNYLMNELMALLQRYAHQSFARVIDGDDLAALHNRGIQPLELAGVATMEAAKQWSLNRLKRHKPVGKEPTVKVVFDDGEKGKGALLDALSAPYPSFEASLTVLPLQAADWLAWELARLHYEHKKHRGGEKYKLIRIRGPIWHAVHHLPHDWKYYHDGRWVDIFTSQEAAAKARQTVNSGESDAH